VSGYSADHLGELVREGKIPNAGRKNAPLIRRLDLPMKAGRRAPHPDTGPKHSPPKEDVQQIATKLRR
jgi:hypothetical protein